MSLLLVTAPAWADGPDGATCVDAYSKAQTLRNDRKLVQARDALRTCAQPTCKDFIIKDCTEWLDQVQEALPSVVPIATDPAGNALSDVKVTLDGATLMERIDGRSVEVNPGPHAFIFSAADGTKAEKQVIVAEGEHSKRVAVVLGTATTPAGAAATPAAAGATGTEPAATPAGTEGAPTGHPFPWKIAGLATAGAGVAGLAVGTIFGVVAMGKKSSAGCSSSSVCPSQAAEQTLNDAGSAATLSTVFFVVGGVLAAGGVAMFAFGPSGSVQAAPAVGLGSAGLVLKGAW